MTSTQPLLLEVQGLSKTYPRAGWRRHAGRVRVLDGIDLSVKKGSITALVGESGSGKTTLAMCLVGLEQPDAGDIRMEGKALPRNASGTRRHALWRSVQLIFQDSADALSPRMTVSEIIEEPLLIQGEHADRERRERISSVLEQVGFSLALKDRGPNELSGGQRQRLAIARALVLQPKLLILDEALAGLDLSIQGQITNLLLDLQSAGELSYLFISHNLELVARIADEIAVIHEGRIVERGTPADLLANAQDSCARSSFPPLRMALSLATGAGD